GVIKNLTKGKGDPSAIFSFNIKGYSVLHTAACFAQLEVCKYLVEELNGDVNAPGYGTGALAGLHLSLSSFLKLVAAMSMIASMTSMIALTMCVLSQVQLHLCCQPRLMMLLQSSIFLIMVVIY
uniref:Uncharacterized protein n=1 Tax=Triticum urartu TaxID=4572 RepID=A0A8R7PQ38_TRIUA